MSLDALRFAPWLTRRRALRIAIIFMVLSLGVVTGDFVRHPGFGILDREGEPLGRDYLSFWSGARFAVAGDLALAYEPQRMHDHHRALFGEQVQFKNYNYPPVAALLTLPLAWLRYVPGLVLWLALGPMLCAFLLARTEAAATAIVLALGSPAALLNAWFGQNGQYSAALFAAGVLLLARRAILSGVCFGFLIFKPQLALLLPLALVAGCHWRCLLATAGTAVSLVGLSIFFLGIAPWRAFFEHAWVVRLIMEQHAGMWHGMPSIFALVRNVGVGVPIAYAAQTVVAAIAVAAVVFTFRRVKCSPLLQGSVLFVATALATPYIWSYDLVALTFITVWLAHDWSRSGFLAWEKIGLAALVTFPVVMDAIATLSRVQIGPIVLALSLLLMLRRVAIGSDGSLEPARQVAGD